MRAVSCSHLGNWDSGSFHAFSGFFKFLEDKWSLFEKFVEDSREMTARENWSAAQRAAEEAAEAKSKGGGGGGGDAGEEKIIVVQGWMDAAAIIYHAAIPCS